MVYISIVLKNVKKQYINGFIAIHNMDLEINDLEFFVLVGQSGCAKSTTLKMIAGLEEITKEEILINDLLVNEVHPKVHGDSN